MDFLLEKANSARVKMAAQAIQDGEVVGIPTETVYGLAVDAANDEAIKKLYKLKKRPSGMPVQTMVRSLQDAEKLGYFDANTKKIAEQFWPGPLTIVCKKRDGAPVSSKVGGGNTIGVRVPDNEVALELMYEFGGPIVVSSANISGEIAPTTANEVRIIFGRELFCVLDGGQSSKNGISSTVIDCSHNEIKILRQGSLAKEDFCRLLKG